METLVSQVKLDLIIDYVPSTVLFFTIDDGKGIFIGVSKPTFLPALKISLDSLKKERKSSSLHLPSEPNFLCFWRIHYPEKEFQKTSFNTMF